jgi:DNA invertase Pin-like site-specific DNA recombinase
MSAGAATSTVTGPEGPDTPRRRLAAYLRVSSTAQLDGLGLDVQEQQVRGWAKAHGHRIVLSARDEGVSGANGVEDRVGLPLALDALRAGEVDGVVVARLDRLARSLTTQEAVPAMVWRLGGHLYASDVGEVARDDPDDPMRTAMRQMAGVFAQLEARMLAKRLRDGRRLKADRGGYAGGGQPLGLRAEGGALVAADDEAEAVELIVSLRRTGRSYRAICTDLAAAGLGPRHGGTWQPAVVRRVALRAGA